jgi:hypothetical protein
VADGTVVETLADLLAPDTEVDLPLVDSADSEGDQETAAALDADADADASGEQGAQGDQDGLVQVAPDDSGGQEKA